MNKNISITGEGLIGVYIATLVFTFIMSAIFTIKSCDMKREQISYEKTKTEQQEETKRCGLGCCITNEKPN